MSGLNPFAALLGPQPPASASDNQGKTSAQLENILEEIFGFTLNENRANTKELLLLKGNNFAQLNLDILGHALFDRLFMCNEEIVNCSKRNFGNKHVYEHRPLVYLSTNYSKLQEEKSLSIDQKHSVRDLILQNVATAMIQPEIYEGQNLHQQMIDILMENFDCQEFFQESCRRVIIEENSSESLKIFLENIYRLLREKILTSTLVNFDFNLFNCLRAFASHEVTAELFLNFNQPERQHIGSDYANTVFGGLLNISIMPKVPGGNHEHFLDPMAQTTNSRLEGILWSSLEKMNVETHSYLLVLLKCSPKIKNGVLTWLGDCLKNNADRGKLWNASNYTNVVDGFMLNVCNVMLRLCQPFCGNFKDKKILKVDPTYAAVPNDKTVEKAVHMHDLATETCFIPSSPNSELNEDERVTAERYNFITDCFFITHKAIELGYRVAVEKLIRLNHEMARMERGFNDAVQQSGGNSDIVESIKDRMKDELTKYLSLKCQLSDPNFTQMMFDFTSASSYWLSQVAVHCDLNKTTYAPLIELPITFPLSTKIPNTLKCIPEFLVENIVSHLVFLRRFNQKVFEEQGSEKLSPILTFILVFMGSQLYLKNPHIRARLAEALESLLPYHKDEPVGVADLGGYQRELLFTSHEHNLKIVENLLDVFVGIEMTGQSVEFEQKFNYRRPMYAVIEYLWDKPDHMQCFRNLAVLAEETIEAVQPPLFLRFANLLINDAIFLLDEALANMAKIKEMQIAQDNGDWNQLSARERTQNISNMHHIGMLARFDNILGRDTITTLEKLTSKITCVFTHTTMVDRVASMLNYFLLNLVGPNKDNFKVKDSKEFSFNPAATVLDICKIYINLKQSEQFCLAVSQDGRSYSASLFPLAEDVLARIGGGALIGELQEVARLVGVKAEEYKANEEAISEAPEHYLDPIMSTLMRDPVILPSSKQTVDRTTIARHLLSDQSDPFNRSPLSMDQVISNKELRDEIELWMAERMK